MFLTGFVWTLDFFLVVLCGEIVWSLRYISQKMPFELIKSSKNLTVQKALRFRCRKCLKVDALHFECA